MKDESAIERIPGRCGGEPCVRGTRITLARLVAELAEDRRVSEYVDDHMPTAPLVTYQQALRELALLLEGDTPFARAEGEREGYERGVREERERSAPVVRHVRRHSCDPHVYLRGGRCPICAALRRYDERAQQQPAPAGVTRNVQVFDVDAGADDYAPVAPAGGEGEANG